MILETERLILRNFIRADQPAFAALREGVDPTVAAREALSYMAAAAKLPRTQYQLAILDRRDGALLGHCGLQLRAIEYTTATFTCEIAPAWRGQGYAYEASQAILDLGFKHLGLTHVSVESEVSDESALRLLTRLGMRPEEVAPGRFRFWKIGNPGPALLGISKWDWKTCGTETRLQQ